jgi:hypothetical protein
MCIGFSNLLTGNQDKKQMIWYSRKHGALGVWKIWGQIQALSFISSMTLLKSFNFSEAFPHLQNGDNTYLKIYWKY